MSAKTFFAAIDVDLKARSNGNAAFRCPASDHEDRNASASANAETGAWLCHACPAKGSAYDLAVLHGRDTREAARLAQEHDVWAEGRAQNNGGQNNGKPSIVAEYDYTDEAGRVLYQVVRSRPKRFQQRRPDGNDGWTWSLGDTCRVLYRLPEVIEAVKAGETVYVAEGEKDVHALEVAGVVATTNAMGAGKWTKDYTKALAGAKRVVVVADRDPAGLDHAERIRAQLAGVVDVVEVVQAKVGNDAADHLAAGHGVDELEPVEAETSTKTSSEPMDVDGNELLEDLVSFIRRYVVLPSDRTADLLALWALHTWAFDAAWATPYLRITSAAASSGKTLLLEVLRSVVRNGWHAVNPSVAVLYRKIDRAHPTLLLDEMDNYPLDDRRDALSVLNTGYKRGAMVDRCKENGDLESFDAFCPKAYAGLDARKVVDTLLSRSITIRLERRLRTEPVERWITPRVEPQALLLRERCEAWAEQHTEALTDHEPELPNGMSDRAAEVWWALLAIADVVGGDWPSRARTAATGLNAGGDETDQESNQVLLLRDVRDAFGDEQAIFIVQLLAKLNALDESPWGSRRRGEGLDARGLAQVLRPFKIKTRTVRIGGTLLKGYRWEQFADAFARHLPDDDEGVRTSDTSDTSDTSTPQSKANVSDVSDASDFQTPPHDGSEPAQESWERYTRKKAEHGERPEHPASHAEPSVPHLPDVPLSDTYTEATPEEEALARRLFSLDKSEPPDEQTPDDADSDLIGEVMHRFTEGDL